MNTARLEAIILNAIARVTPDDWLPCSIGDLRNRMGEIEQEAANATIPVIAEAMISLAQEAVLLLCKRDDGGKRLPFDIQKRLDEGYISNFFARNGFEVKLTHEGRRRTNENGRNAASSEESEDCKFARLAIEEARKSISENDGRPHPLVGAVVVKNGQVLATAHRGEAEGNHAEYIALEKRLPDAAVAGSTVYTTLEPCTTRNHPKIPCAERLILRKVRRVVIGMLDPDPRITGRGQRSLRKANIVTDFFPHDLMTEVEELNRDFTRHFESESKVAEPPAPHKLAEINIDISMERLRKHRESVTRKLEDTQEFGLVEIACFPVQPVEISVRDLEQFVQKNRFKFSEAMRHFPSVEVFQSGISVGYFPRSIRENSKSTMRITLYKDGLAVFDALADSLMRREKALHAGWLSYEIQRELQLAKNLLENKGVSSMRIVLCLENIEPFALKLPNMTGLWLDPSKYAGSHEPIMRTVSPLEIHDHEGEKRNLVMPVVEDIMEEVCRIFGRAKPAGLWAADGNLLYVKGLENSR